MDVIVLLFWIAVIGLAAYLLRKYIPMPAPIPAIIVGVACFGIVLLVASFFGLDFHVPNVRR